MKLSDVGEFGFIARFSPAFLRELPEGVRGIGDDCAVIPPEAPDVGRTADRGPVADERVQLVTTDMLVEDVHFLRRRIPARDLGHKSLAVNLSDVAAMGGTPSSAYLALAIPADLDVAWLDEFFAGFHELGREARVPLLGGDTTRSPGPLVIAVTVLGTCRHSHLKLRSAARTGDVVCVTGWLGDSAGGLRLLTGDGAADAVPEAAADAVTDAAADAVPEAAADAVTGAAAAGAPDGHAERLVREHHRPRAHLAEGAWLGARPGVHAMLDVSDGLDSDCRRVMEQSRCGMEIDVEALPISPALAAVAARRGWDPRRLAAAGGEDYCLLATVAADAFPAVATDFARDLGRPLHAVGRVVDGGDLRYLAAGGDFMLDGRSWDHFGPDHS
ncbi:MAG: thiamine-phosphate kinase [Candidatus Krumholzibacteriia bacterium]